MKRSCFTEEQMIAILRESEAEAKTDELCRRRGISQATVYAARKKFGGMEPSDAKRLVADQMLDISAMKELLAKNG